MHRRPMAVEDCLKKLPMAPKSKAHIRSVMHLMFECATRWELFTEQRNPIALVRVKGGSKRRQRPTTLTVDEFETIVATLKEPYRTMVYIAQCLGLRVSEIAALQWDDFDFEEKPASCSAQFRERESGRRQDRILPGLRSFASVLDRDRARVEQGGRADGRRLGLCQSGNRAPVSSHGDPETAFSSFGMLRGRVSNVRCGTGRVVLAR